MMRCKATGLKDSRRLSGLALLVILLWVATPAAGAQEAQPGPAPAGASATEARELATEAYIYGYPLVLMEILKGVMTNVAGPEGFHAPLGQFAHVRQFPDASFKGAAIPNRDLLYSFAWLDLSKEPYILSLPDMRGRYFFIEMVNAWTEVFAAPGKRTSGTRAQKFLITGPAWHGQVPPGYKRIKSSTNLVWLIGRTFSTGTPEDYQKVAALQDRYTLIPWSARGKSYTPPPGKVNPEIDMKTSAWEQVNRLSPPEFFKIMAAAMQGNPPAPADAAMVARLVKLGIVPGQAFEAEKLDPEITQAINEAPLAAKEKIQAHGKEAVTTVNGWSYVRQTGVYGTDYLQRAYVAMIDLGAAPPRDVIEMTARVDAAGQPLTGTQRYVLHFPRGKKPPVKGFWSLTLYNAGRSFVANPLNRYSLDSRHHFIASRDGSTDILLQADSPGKDKEANWLPAPAGDFFLMLRLYGPQEPVLSGAWKPSAVQQRPQ